MLNFQSCAIFWVVLLYFKHKSYFLRQTVSNSIFFYSVKRFTGWFTGDGGVSLTYRVKPGPSASFPASIWVANVVEIWSWNQCGITHPSTHHPASKNVLCPSAHLPLGQSRVPLTVHRWWSHQTWAGWGHGDKSMCRVAVSSWEQMKLWGWLWAHVNSLAAASSSMKPTLLPSAMGFFARGAAVSVLPLFFSSVQSLMSCTLILLEGGIYEFLISKKA